MSELVELINSRNIGQLAEECERLELDESVSPLGIPPPEIYASLLLAYLIQNSLESARFLWLRIPEPVRQANPDLGLIWQVGRQLWQRNYDALHPAVAALSALPSLYWPLVQELQVKQQDRMFQLLSKVYTSLSLDTAVRFLGTPPVQLLEAVAAQGWQYDEATQILRPAQPTCSNRAGHVDSLSALSGYILHLEK